MSTDAIARILGDDGGGKVEILAGPDARGYRFNPHHDAHGKFSSGEGGSAILPDQEDKFGNVQWNGQWYNDYDLPTATRMTKEYIDQYGMPATEAHWGDPGHGFSIVLSERGQFHIAQDRIDKAKRPGLEDDEQGMGDVRDLGDVTLRGLNRNDVLSLSADVKGAYDDLPGSTRFNQATGLNVASGQEHGSIILSGAGNGGLDRTGKSVKVPSSESPDLIDALDAIIQSYDDGHHLTGG